MNLFTRHPGLRGVIPYADGETDEAETRRIREHLQDCERCRRELHFVLELKRAARELSHPSPPKGTLEEILRRREAGERVILPTSPPPPRRRSPRLTGPLLVLLALAGIATAVLLISGEASAGASSLHIGPERPHLGQPLEVEFRAASPLAAEERLVLRGRYRTADAEPPSRDRLGSPFRQELERTEKGVFSGTAWLPPSAVYALFAVEDADGSRVETDAGRPWEVLAHDGDGRPLFAALAQRFRAVEAMGRPDEMRATALRMTELYPDEPQGWVFRLHLERQVVDPGEADRVVRFHRGQLARLEQAVSRMEDPGGDRVAAVARYAKRLGEEESERLWTRRLLEEHPHHPQAQRERVLSIVAGSRARSGDPGERLRVVELEWDRAGAVDGLLLETGFQAALASGDPDAVREWADRYERFRPERAARIAEELVRRPALRPLGMERIRALLERLEAPPPDERPLLTTRAEHERAVARTRRGLLTLLGQALVAEGRLGAGLEALERAAAVGWDPAAFRALAAARIRAGDTAGGLRLYGMAAADPLEPEGALEAARAAAGPAFDAAAWPELVAAGRRELRRRLADAPVRWPAREGETRVLDARGREVALERRLEGRVSLLAFWARGTVLVVESLPALQRRAGLLEAAGAQVLTITIDPPSPGLDAFLEELGVRLPVLHDVGREAAEAFSAWGRPWYVVLDPEGLIRYEGESLECAVRHAVALGRADAA